MKRVCLGLYCLCTFFFYTYTGSEQSFAPLGNEISEKNRVLQSSHKRGLRRPVVCPPIKVKESNSSLTFGRRRSVLDRYEQYQKDRSRSALKKLEHVAGKQGVAHQGMTVEELERHSIETILSSDSETTSDSDSDSDIGDGRKLFGQVVRMYGVSNDVKGRFVELRDGTRYWNMDDGSFKKSSADNSLVLMPVSSCDIPELWEFFTHEWGNEEIPQGDISPKAKHRILRRDEAGFQEADRSKNVFPKARPARPHRPSSAPRPVVLPQGGIG